VFLPSEGMHKIYSPPNTSLHGSDGVKSGLLSGTGTQGSSLE